jgi:hypothetical protein
MEQATKDVLAILLEKYGEINLRTVATEITHIIKEAKSKKDHKVSKAKFNTLNDLLALMSETLMKSNTIKVVYKDMILIIGDDSVITGRKSRQQIVDSPPEMEYRLIDGMMNDIGYFPKKEFSILPAGDESEPTIVDIQKFHEGEGDVLTDIENAMSLISGMYNKETYAVRAPMGFGISAENEKFQIQISMVRNLDWISEPQVVTIEQYNKVNNITEKDKTNPIFKKPQGQA